MKLRKKKSKNGDWIVINDSTGDHAHFDTKFGANTIIYLLRNNIKPSNPYFIESKRRLLEESNKYKKNGKKKQRYYNSQRV